MASRSAASSTERHSGPTVSCVPERGKIPPIGSRPPEDLAPTIPQKAAGMRIEPPVSEPSAQGTSPPATAAPDPEEEPPGACAAPGAAGLRGVPKCGFWPSAE